MARGLPPKVEPWLPAVMPRAASSVARQAPIGKPPPRPLAAARMSGSIPAHWWANIFPVRPTPVCTSSRMRSTPCRSHNSRRALSQPVGATLTPPSPCTGSTMMAPVLGPMAAAAASRSPNGTMSKPSAGSPKPSRCLGFLAAAIVASVRPWKAPVKVTVRHRSGCPFT